MEEISFEIEKRKLFVKSLKILNTIFIILFVGNIYYFFEEPIETAVQNILMLFLVLVGFFSIHLVKKNYNLGVKVYLSFFMFCILLGFLVVGSNYFLNIAMIIIIFTILTNYFLLPNEAYKLNIFTILGYLIMLTFKTFILSGSEINFGMILGNFLFSTMFILMAMILLRKISKHLLESIKISEDLRKKSNDLHNEFVIKSNKELEEKNKKLKEENTKINILLNNLPQKIFFKDSNSVYITCNRNYANDLNISIDNIIGKNDYDFYSEELAKKYTNDDKNVISNKTIQEFEETYKINKIETTVKTIKVPITNSQNNVIGLIGIFWDITEEKNYRESIIKAKEEALKATELKNQFLANVSHELRTPLNSVIGFSDILSTMEDDIEKKDLIETINYSGKSLLNLINDILDLSKIELEKFELYESEFSISKIFNMISTIVKENKEKNENVINIKINDKVPKILIGNEKTLFQILINLVSNAIKFTKKGTINLSCDILEENKEIVKTIFIIEDSGIGIESKNFDLIFQKFTQIENHLTRKYEGTGLGLSLVKKYVEVLDGIIYLESTIGKGSKFFVELPIKKSSKSLIENDLKKEHKVSALVIDDFNDFHKLAKYYVKGLNISLEFSPDGEDALEKLNSKNFDLVFLDIQLPKVNGFEVLKEFRKSNQKSIVIGISAHAKESDVQMGLSLGMNSYLKKPVTQLDFVNEIKKYFNC